MRKAPLGTGWEALLASSQEQGPGQENKSPHGGPGDAEAREADGQQARGSVRFVVPTSTNALAPEGNLAACAIGRDLTSEVWLPNGSAKAAVGTTRFAT